MLRSNTGKNKIEFKEQTLQLHNELAVVNARWGLGRGQSIMETGARHRSTEEYRRELRRECDNLELQISDRHQTLRELYADIRKADKRCKALTTMVRNLETRETDSMPSLTSWKLTCLQEQMMLPTFVAESPTLRQATNYHILTRRQASQTQECRPTVGTASVRT